MSFVTNDAIARTDPSPMVSVLPGEAAITQFAPTKAFLPKIIVPGPPGMRDYGRAQADLHLIMNFNTFRVFILQVHIVTNVNLPVNLYTS